MGSPFGRLILSGHGQTLTHTDFKGQRSVVHRRNTEGIYIWFAGELQSV